MSGKAKASLPARVGSLLLTAIISSDICLFGRPQELPLTRQGYCFEFSIRAATVLGGNEQSSQALRVFKPAAVSFTGDDFPGQEELKRCAAF
jgi:hypothetical protein